MEELNIQQEKFNLLLENQNEFTLYEQLTLANCLKNKVISNEAITSASQIDLAVAEQKKALLENIDMFINSTIQEVIACRIEPTYDNRVVIPDFSAAKKKLEEIISEEANKTIFSAEKDIFVDIPDISKYIQSLSTIKENCQKNRYTVLLMGEFQSGKTTTLDALCDGRHIGAIGDGTATSAVPVSVSYAEKEDVNPVWKTNEELKLLFSSLPQCIEEFDYNEFNINDIEERQTWLTKIDKFRNNKDCPQDVKILALCSLVLKFYDTNELKGNIDSKIQITDVASITRFPKNLETRWKRFGSSAFTLEESLFIFVEQIDCFLPAETLKKLNCTIIDCPGLFNNTYDTSVTEMMMAKVHAIVYLLPYHKVFGEDIGKSLYTIQKNYPDVHRKLFIAQNISSKGNNTFVESNIATIKCMFGDDKQVTIYDAHLAYLSSVYYYKKQLLIADIQHFCRDVIEHKYDLITKLTIKKTIKFQNFDEAWNYHFKGYMTANEWGDIPSPEYLKKASGIENFISDLRTFIENNEAYSVILSNGVYKLQSEMIRIKSDLYTRYVEPKILGRDNIASLWEERLTKSKLFDQFLATAVKETYFQSNTTKQSLLTRLTNDVYDKLFTHDFYLAIYDDIADTLYDNKGKIITTGVFNKKKFQSHITPIINQKIYSIVENKMEYWYRLLCTGQDKSFANLFSSEMKLLDVYLQKEWNNNFLTDKEFMLHQYISIHSVINEYIDNPLTLSITDRYGTFKSSTKIINQAGMAVLKETIMAIVSSAVMSICNYIAWALFSAASGLWILLLVGGAAVAVITMGKSRQWIRKKFKESLFNDLDKLFKEKNIKEQFKNIIHTEVNRILNLCMKKLSLDITKMENERDIAIYTPIEQVEDRCFHAVHIINSINEQLVEYENFKKQYVKYE